MQGFYILLFMLFPSIASIGDIFDLQRFGDASTKTTFANVENDEIRRTMQNDDSRDVIFAENNNGMTSPRRSPTDIESVIDNDQLTTNGNDCPSEGNVFVQSCFVDCLSVF